MKSACGPRSSRRHRRPAAALPTRHQLRAEVDRLQDLYELEVVLELCRLKPDMNLLMKLDLESSYLRDVLTQIAGKP